VYVLPRFPHSGRRLIVGLLLAVVLFFNSAGTLFAGTTGTINGTITDAKTQQPLAGVTVDAVSPTARYTTKTDAKGFFGFTGVSPDTYTVSFQIAGFQPYSVTGINVFADSVAQVSETLQKSLVTIGRVTARSQIGAYQPKQTQDTYTVTDAQITTNLGKKEATSETNLILSLPGASRDSSGYPVIRGGRENEEGFQYEGIPFTDAFTNQFVNSLALNGGVGELQLTPGANDASTGNNGTGSLNLISKRGTNPAFGLLDLETLVYPYTHQLGLEYGFATPNGRVSNYIAFQGSRAASTFGSRGNDSTLLSRFYSRQFQMGNDITDNFVFKFGRSNNQSLQLFYSNENFKFINNNGGIDNLQSKPSDPFALANLSNFTGLSGPSINSSIGLDPYQSDPNGKLNRPTNITQPNEAFKIQYSNNLDASTFLTTKFYKVNSVATFDEPYASAGYRYFSALQGGLSDGVTLDITKQAGSKNLIKLGGSYAFLHPVFNFLDPSLGYLAAGGFQNGYEIADFLPANNPDCAPPPNSPPGTTVSPLNTSCGYLTQFFPNGVPRVPAFLETTGTNRQDYGLYLNDTVSPNDKLKIDLGARVDGANYRFTNEAPCNAYSAAGVSLDTTNQCFFAANGKDAHGNPHVTVDKQARQPVVFEPRAAVAIQLTRNDAIRASYGRSVEFAPLGDIDNVISRDYYQTYKGIPSYNNFLDTNNKPIGGNAMTCGVTQNRACVDYADQLFWENQNFSAVPIQPAKPETFNNYDFSYSHAFPANVSVKITPFYRRGYDAVAQTQSIKTDKAGNAILDAFGSPLLNPALTTNLGINRTTGVEFYLTKDAAYGLSGSLSATYINEITNVPPLISSEDFFPTIPPASLALGNTYRVGFLSPFQATLAVQYKTRSGLRFNPIVSYNRGYPIGSGTITQTFVNGKAVNVPNTNFTSPNGATGTQQYLDPQNPGSIVKPNIAATRGGGLGPSPGSILSLPNINTNFTLEYSAPGSRSTLGVLVSNVFGNVYNGSTNPPVLNSRYQPVANGIAGPRTGYSATPLSFPGIGISPFYGKAANGNQAFINFPNGAPTTFRLYYQLGL